MSWSIADGNMLVRAPSVKRCPECDKIHKRKSRYCSQSCASKYRIKSRPFIAIDGEAQKDLYTILAAGNHSGFHRDIRNRKGLSTEECLDFLLSLPRGSASGMKPIYVWFAFDYDVNMMLGDIPLKGKNSIEELYANGKDGIKWRGYRIRYFRRKIFRVSRADRVHTSYDIWGFFQSSFEKSLESWGIESTELIEQGKANRASFGSWSLNRIAEYNRDELSRLSLLAEKLRDSVSPLELPIQSWHGPAAFAGAWLQKNKAMHWLEETPDEMMDPATRAYFGGRIDVLGYGYVEPVYHYDIVSAYPSAIRFLPDLTKLKWKEYRSSKLPSEGIYCAEVSWDIPFTYWGPFPWRDKHGTILWPLSGRGWYWNYEIEAAFRKYGRNHFKVHRYFGANGQYVFPFKDLVEQAFRYRAALKREGNPSHVSVKLILNSLYGKFAQTVGSSRFYSPIWAGLITAYARAQLASAITDSTVCVMTDSIWSSEPLSLPLGKDLGDWEAQDESRLWLAEAGLYAAETADGELFTWQRGFDKKNPVDIKQIVSDWLTSEGSHSAVSYEVTRFIGMGLALNTHQPWRRWVTIQRNIEPVPIYGTTKRMGVFPVNGEYNPGQFQKLKPIPVPEDVCSYPYEKLTRDPTIRLRRLEEECEEEEE